MHNLPPGAVVAKFSKALTWLCTSNAPPILFSNFKNVSKISQNISYVTCFHQRLFIDGLIATILDTGRKGVDRYSGSRRLGKNELFGK